MSASIRAKLLAMGLLPLLVVLPLLGTLLLVWGNAAFDRLLITKVRSDLAVAHGYFDRVLGDVGSGTESLADSHALLRELLRADPPSLQSLLQRERVRLGLDFLNLYDASGAMRARDVGAPGSAGLTPSELGAVTDAAPQHAHITLLSAQQVAQLAPQWREVVSIPLVPTRGAAPTERTQEDRALVALARIAVQADDGATLGVVEGGVLLNRNLRFIDHINAIVYPEGSLPYGSQGTATLFLEDVRVTTNVRLFENERAIGTRVSQAVRDAVLGRGETWLDRAFVVKDWYVSGYQPLVDGEGRRVGMLYVGILERPFTLVKYGVLAAIGAIFIVVMLVAAGVSLRWARSIFRPLERMTHTMQTFRAGRLEARVGPLPVRDEIGELAVHLDQLLDTIDDKTRALQRWADELDHKVSERTAELAASTRDLQASHASLQAAQQQLVRSEKLAAIGQLTASIAHEVNNPIAVIQGNLDLVRELLGEAAGPVRGELRLIDEQIDRMRLIVTQLLQFARPTEFAGYVDNVDPAEVIDASLLLVAHQLTRAGIEVKRNYASRRRVGINRSELQQVLINLMVNAAQVMAGGGTLEVATRDWGEDGVEIEIADTGPGLAPEVLEQLFRPFYTTRREGNGLGLWISLGIVERYGGRIEARNRDGTSGAAFVVRLYSEPQTTAAEGPVLAA